MPKVTAAKQEYDRQRYLSTKDKRIAQARQWYAAHKKRHQEISTEYRKHNLTEARARMALNNAIRDGRVVRKPCQVCGNPTSEGHHMDYAKPLEVMWLCVTHHKEHHRLQRIERTKIKEVK